MSDFPQQYEDSLAQRLSNCGAARKLRPEIEESLKQFMGDEDDPFGGRLYARIKPEDRDGMDESGTIRSLSGASDEIEGYDSDYEVLPHVNCTCTKASTQAPNGGQLFAVRPATGVLHDRFSKAGQRSLHSITTCLTADCLARSIAKWNTQSKKVYWDNQRAKAPSGLDARSWVDDLDDQALGSLRIPLTQTADASGGAATTGQATARSAHVVLPEWTASANGAKEWQDSWRYLANRAADDMRAPLLSATRPSLTAAQLSALDTWADSKRLQLSILDENTDQKVGTPTKPRRLALLRKTAIAGQDTQAPMSAASEAPNQSFIQDATDIHPSPVHAPPSSSGTVSQSGDQYEIDRMSFAYINNPVPSPRPA